MRRNHDKLHPVGALGAALAFGLDDVTIFKQSGKQRFVFIGAIFGAMQCTNLQADIANKAVTARFFNSPAAVYRKMYSSPAQCTRCCSDRRSPAF